MQRTIRSEDDAYEVLEAIAQRTFDSSDVDIRLDGWPKLVIHLQGPRYHQTITPSVMKGFLQFQKEIYRSYAYATFNSPNLRGLTKEDREDFEIEVKVSDGTSGYEIDLQALVLKLLEKVGDKVPPDQIVPLILGAGVLLVGSSTIRKYLDYRKGVRESELRTEQEKEMLKTLQYSSDQETKRAEILTELSRDNARLSNIMTSASDAHTALIKSLSDADNAEIQGVELSGEVAEELTKNARRKSIEIRLDGVFRILRVDSSDPTKFKVRIMNVEDAEQLDAILQESSLTSQNRPILQDAEWSRKKVELKINAKELEGEIRDATIIGVKAVTTSRSQTKKKATKKKGRRRKKRKTQ